MATLFWDNSIAEENTRRTNDKFTQQSSSFPKNSQKFSFVAFANGLSGSQKLTLNFPTRFGREAHEFQFSNLVSSRATIKSTYYFRSKILRKVFWWISTKILFQLLHIDDSKPESFIHTSKYEFSTTISVHIVQLTLWKAYSYTSEKISLHKNSAWRFPKYSVISEVYITVNLGLSSSPPASPPSTHFHL